MNDKSNEANAVAFFSYKRLDGFEVSLTLRDDTGDKVLARIEAAIKVVIKEGGQPVAKNAKFTPNLPLKATKPCPVHSGSLLTEKPSKTGTGTYWSHYIGTYPNGKSCYGKPSVPQDPTGIGLPGTDWIDEPF